MKTAEEIFKTNEEAFKAMGEYVKQESIAFLKYAYDNDIESINDRWFFCDSKGAPYCYTTEELYSLYLQSKEK